MHHTEKNGPSPPTEVSHYEQLNCTWPHNTRHITEGLKNHVHLFQFTQMKQDTEITQVPEATRRPEQDKLSN